MTKTTLNILFLFVVLLLAQAVIFNNLVLFNCAIPFVFIYIIISLPVTIGTNVALTLGFFTGLGVDIFTDTYGLNALACTILAFVRKPVLHLYVQRDEDFSGQSLTSRSMGFAAFMKYALTMSLIYCVMVFVIEAFSFFNIFRLLLRIGASALYSFIIIYAIDSLSLSRREKKF